MDKRMSAWIIGGSAIFFGLCWMLGAIQLRYYTSLGPGPGFFSVWLAGILIVLGAFIVITNTVRRSVEIDDQVIPSRSAMLKIAGVLGILVLVALTLEPLGYRLVTFLMLCALLSGVCRMNIVPTVAVALIGSIGVFYLFVSVLKTSLPIGMFGF